MLRGKIREYDWNLPVKGMIFDFHTFESRIEQLSAVNTA
jgi:hypothetical protein